MLLTILVACVRPTPIGADDWPTDGCVAAEALSDGLRVKESRFTLTLPDGAELAAALLAPREPGCYPALLLVPPGFEAGLSELDEDPHRALAAKGVVLAAFDPRGRGESSGEDDHGGPTQQDDLAAILAWLAARPEVDPTCVVVRSRSYGVAMVAGALDRHPTLAPFAAVDIEGPALLPDDLEHVSDFTRERFHDLASDDAWWIDRSASLHIGTYTGHYLRIQGRMDHASGPWRGHAVEMLVAAQAGAPASVTLNGATSASWDATVVSEGVLPGEINHGEPAVMSQIEALLAP